MVFGSLLLAAALPFHAQVTAVPSASQDAAAQPGQPPGFAAPADPGLQKRMELARNNDRQKELVADTQKLFALAQQLRDEVAKTKSDQLSVDVVRTTAQIEKLARSVNEKMRGY